MAHEITPDQDNPFLELGRVVEKNFYERRSKFYDLDKMKIDLVLREGENILIGEVKKSSKYEKSIIMQIIFYLKKLKEHGLNVRGEILIPKERKVIKVELTKEYEDEIEKAIDDIHKIIVLDEPPKLIRNRFCTNCAFREFCWS